jgi:hypothetical protein
MLTIIITGMMFTGIGNESSRIDPVVPPKEPPMEGWPKDAELTIFIPDNRI